MYTITGPITVGGAGIKGGLILNRDGTTYRVTVPDVVPVPYEITLPSLRDGESVIAVDQEGRSYTQRTSPVIYSIRYQLDQDVTSGQTVVSSGWQTISPTELTPGSYILESTIDDSSITLTPTDFSMKGGAYHVVMEAVVSYSSIHSQLRLYNSTAETSSWGCAGSFRHELSDTPLQETLFLMDIVEVPLLEEHMFQVQIKAPAGAVFGDCPNFPNENTTVTLTITKLRG